jgi:hypothetical protein
MPAIRTSPLFVFLAVSAVTLAGCGPGQKTVYPVRGKIVDSAGKPAAGVLVMFHPTTPPGDEALAVTGTTDDNGEFQLTTYRTGDGAPAGEYLVTIVWLPQKKSPFDAQPDKLGGRYASKDKPAAKFTVERKSDNQMPPITIK